MLEQFILTLLSPFGFAPLSLSAITELLLSNSITSWYGLLLNPNVILPILFYLAFGYALLYITLILPFRYFKWVLRVPDRKGKK